VNSYLNGVWALNAGDAWAVGDSSLTQTSGYQTLTEHWDGSAWRVVPSPNVKGVSNYLWAVSGSSASVIWSVGDTFNGYGSQALIERWNGSIWKIEPAPNETSATQLFGTVAIAQNDAWAVGYTGTSTLAIQWNGRMWANVPSQNPGAFDYFQAVSAIPADNSLWAVGFQEGLNILTLIEEYQCAGGFAPMRLEKSGDWNNRYGRR
jgi:hypothetical protein